MKIATKNVYYMLSYAFRALNQKEYGKVETETFENIADLFAEILSIGINKQIKQGQAHLQKAKSIPLLQCF